MTTEQTEKNTSEIPMILYHVTTQKKAKKYHQSGFIQKPVRGFSTLEAAMFWAMKANRKVIYKIEADKPYKMPEHHSDFGEAWWNDNNVPIEKIKCVVSAA